MTKVDIEAQFGGLIKALMTSKITTLERAQELDLFDGLNEIICLIIKRCVKNRKKLMFIGNGGSAAIASHQALDFFNCGIKARAFNDPCFLTCMGNDFGFENIFVKQLLPITEKGDVLVAISSSGKSPDILKGVEAAKEKGCQIITMSGFQSNNPLRKKGDVNLYVPSDSYRFVEAVHSLYWDFILEMTIAEMKK